MAGETRWRKLKKFVQSQGWRWESGKPISYGKQIVVSAGTHRATVNFYPKRGKMVVGGPASPLRDQLDAWIRGEAYDSSTASDVKTSSILESSKRNRLDALKGFIRERGWNWGPGADIPHGEQIVVSDAGVTAMVNFWSKSGKMRVQGKASPLKSALQLWVDANTGPTSSEDERAITGSHVGMDESGKGDWYGPLVVAAVYLDKPTMEALRKAGVRDSKDLSPEAIQRIAAVIERTVPSDRRHVWAIEPEMYNQVYPEHENVNLLLADAYARVAEEVWRATQVDTIVCDQFSQRADRLESTFAAHSLPDPVQEHKAESISIAVAAASILASAEFASALKRLGYEAGLGGPLPKGASDVDALERAAREIIATQGEEALVRYAKLNFKPVRALLSQAASQAASRQLGVEAQPGEPVMIQCENWQLQYHPNGFWRYTFADGGILDWHEDTTGRLDVRGKPSAPSYKVLMEKAHGKLWQGEQEAVEKSINKHIPRFKEARVISVQGVGWHRQETVLGARFNFTDGGVLNYYRGKGTLSIQGTPSPLTQEVLKALPSPFWGGSDELSDTLKKLFPDWRIGETDRPEGTQDGTSMSEEAWSPLENALDWRALWPTNYDLRQSADQKSPCQRAMLQDWASVLMHHQEKRDLLVHAPTGLGKTLAALVPALAWVADAPDRRRIYYLVNRVTQHENPLRELRDKLATRFEEETGQQLKLVDLVGRGRLCSHPKAQPLPDLCRKARDTASFDLLPEGVPSWREVKEHLPAHTCPYHTLQGLMAQAHVVICDYWWLFSPMAQESGLLERAGFSPQDSIVIVDEAHNLVGRVRSWLDVDEPMERIVKAIGRAPHSVGRCLKPVLDVLRSAELDAGLDPSALLARAGGANRVRTALSDLAMDDLMKEYATVPERILRLLLYPDQAVVVYPTEDFRTGERRLVFRLVDPTPLLQAGYGNVHASLSMSGTLAAPADGESELQYQVPIFGLPLRETLSRKYASPFPLRNQRWIYCTDTYGTYRRRGDYMGLYAEHIVSVGQATPGVTAVFFSSYAFLEQVLDGIVAPSERALIVAERRGDAVDPGTGGDVSDYEERLRAMVKEHGRAYLFAVYQGKLAEGADFQDNLIKTVICVSIPMEYPVLFHQQLEALYAERFSEVAEVLGDDPEAKAHEYALDRYSLSLVLQACGRGIRDEMDRCAFVLLDERYDEYGWRRFLEPRPYNLQQPRQAAKSFHGKEVTVVSRKWDRALIP
jgi:ribonuclease HIII